MIETIKPLYNEHSSLTLLVDGNWLLMSRIAVLRNKYFDTESLVHELQLLMIRSINAILRSFPEIDNIIFIMDGGSWRSKVKIPEFLVQQGISYKGNREKTEGIDWNKVFDAYEALALCISQWSEVSVCTEHSIEGDDWCWWWSNILNNDNTNVIIWSADKDLTQLVKYNENNGVFTGTLYSRGSKTVLTLSETVKTDTENSLTSFFNPNYVYNYNILNSIIKKSSDINYIKPSDVVIDKIFRGDAGDNILPVITKETKTGRKMKLTDKQLDKTINIWDDDSLYNFIDNILESKLYKDKVTDTKDNIKEHVIYNRKLVALDEYVYDKSIIDTMLDHNYYNKSNDLSVVEQRIKGETDDMSDLLNSI